jgi:hypothetical protein
VDKEKTVFPVLAAMILCLSACSVVPDTTQATEKTFLGLSQVPKNTKTPSLTFTLTITPTPTVTATATITPTPTPPPDLELTNVTLVPNTFNSVGKGYQLMGRIRNNTNTTMILLGDSTPFIFTVETWEYDKQMKIFQDPEYFHIIFKEVIQVGWDYRVMNCILYPGEEGVIAIGIGPFAGASERTLYEYTKDYKGPLGIWYSYQSFYDTKSNLPAGFHYKAENVTMQKEDWGIIFDFDLNILNNHLYHGLYYDNPTWVIIYDKDGKIIDIFYKDLTLYPGYDIGKLFHVHFSTAYAIQNPEYFKPFMEVTPEITARADHIEVFSELNESPVCSRQQQN